MPGSSSSSGKKRDVVPFVEQFCAALAFERRRNRWRKKAAGGLVFEVGVFLGGNPYCVGWAPLIFRIFHESDPKFAFHTEGGGVLDRLVPGADDYGRGGKASDYVLGIRALIELFNVIADSFDQSSGTQSS